jgi:L-histidine Nalpha-methyltransferase
MESEFAADVWRGLTRTQKELPSKYLYDDLGSALFDAITRLPEYGLTRADQRVLERCALELEDGYRRVVELGSGSGLKTRVILESVAARHAIVYQPIDLSGAALAACEKALGDLATVEPIEAGFFDGLDRVAISRDSGGPLLVLFLGSTIGNFDARCAADFLCQVRGRLRDGDAFLIGFDLVKPRPQLLAAYDDPTGVTAAFNRNILGRINRELDGEFDLRRFAHEARYDAAEQRVEMHLLSLGAQEVRIGALDLTAGFQDGETIWTESSHKYTPDQIEHMAISAGFRCARTWTDEEWPFAESLWIAA